MSVFSSISRKNRVRLAILATVSLGIFIFSLFPRQVERWYSTGLYPGISVTLRILTRWIPFSLGDLMYAAIILRLIVVVTRWVIRLIRKEYSREHLKKTAVILAKDFFWIYIVFKLVWGLNYNRLGIEYQLGIQKTQYNSQQLAELTDELIARMNACRKEIRDSSLPSMAIDTAFREAFLAYQNASYTYDFLDYSNLSVKKSLYTGVADYVGFTGYYNPFTGEAQVRTDIPSMLVPYIVCHEMAHQLGYASESEANFVGYLACSASSNPLFRYSVYSDLFTYAQGEQIILSVQAGDSSATRKLIEGNRSKVDSLVRKDRREVREFFNRRRKRVTPAFSGLYDQYLKMNKQMEGINSYNEVVGWLISYRKKYGKI